MKRLFSFFLIPLGCLSIAGFWGCSPKATESQRWIQNDSVNFPIQNPLVSESGKIIKTVKQWETIRRPELLKLFEQQMYGAVPEGIGVQFRERYASPDYLEGKATIREFEMLVNDEPVPQMHVLFFIPNGVNGKVPVILGYGWDGNETQCTDTMVDMMNEEQVAKRILPRKLEKTLAGMKRATKVSRSIERIIDNGYAYITANYWELEPDNNECFAGGVRALVSKGQPLADNAWGAIAAWAWGMSRMLDLAETIAEIDATRCAVVGHSRLGKTAILAGVRDKRFAIVTSNDSGCGGASLSKRVSGETVKIINEKFPYWFCKNFHEYGEKEEELPMDQHLLLALVAPRPLYVCSGVRDLWADPLGEYLSVFYANPVWELYGKKPMPFTEATSLPPTNTPQIGDAAYHVENAGHSFSSYDWEQFLSFFDRYLKK
jgi:hypothetical protein